MRIKLAAVFVFALAVMISTGSLFSAKAHIETEFTVRIINVSRGDSLETSAGTRLFVPLAPGVFVIHNSDEPIFADGVADFGRGLEALAEDGNPGLLADAFRTQSGAITSGAFTTQLGLDMPGAIGPGQAYQFTFVADEGARLSLATMFVHSNDLFYAPGPEGIELFDENERPLSGDITEFFELWDAGTEINQEPGIGSDQAPRQSGPNIGADENGVVRVVSDVYEYPAVKDVIKIIISAN